MVNIDNVKKNNKLLKIIMEALCENDFHHDLTIEYSLACPRDNNGRVTVS
jgi:hypothetical protein